MNILGIGIFALIVLIPIMISGISSKIVSEITADGMLNYIIGVLSVVSTVFLSFVMQTINANKMAKEANTISKKCY